MCEACQMDGEPCEQFEETIREIVRDETEETRETVEQHDEQIEELEEAVDPDDVGSKQTLPGAVDHLGKDLAEVNGRLASMEDQINAVGAVEGADGEPKELTRDDLTPMEQIAALPEPVAAEQFDNHAHRNTFRARSIVRDFGDYAEKTGRGKLIKNPDLTKVLTAQEEHGKVESKTGARVMERIQELSKGAFVHETPEENPHGVHILILDEPDALVTFGGTGGVVSREGV